MNTTSKLLVAPTMLALALSLAACGGNGDDTGAPATPATPSTSTTTDPGTNTISPPLKTPPALDNSVGAFGDVQFDPAKCGTSAGPQKVTGKVTNKSKAPADYVIEVNWTNATSDVLGNGIAVVKRLAAGKSADWSTSGKVAAGATQCVLHVTRGTLAG